MDNKHSNFPAACAIISISYLSDGRVLAASYLKHHPGARFYLLVVDTLESDTDPGPGVRIVHIDDLNLPYFTELSFKYSPTELCCALKPTLLNYLLTVHKEERVIYFDSDILVMRRLDRLMDCLTSSDIVLTPHLLKPIPADGLRPNEQDILVAGAHNLGFIAIRKSPVTLEFLRWWKGQLRDGGFIEFSQGLLTDQRWVDLVPALFPTTLLKDETYNVAYWNIHSRPISRDGDTFLVNGRNPISFFHFSGFDPARPSVFSKHQNRTRIEKGSALADLLQHYVGLQIQNGFERCRMRPYGFGRFDNGVAIGAPMRRLYSQFDRTQRLRFGNPFSTVGNSFLDWATQPDSRGLSPFLRSLYEMRPDLGIAFRDVNGKDREAFLDWASTHGAAEYKYDAVAMRVKTEANSGVRKVVLPRPRCSVILPVCNSEAFTNNCLDIVLNRMVARCDFETIVVNDGSTDGTSRVLESYRDRIRVVSHETPSGFPLCCNDAAAIAGGEYLVFLSDDTEPREGWLDSLVRYADAHPEAAIVGSRLVFTNGTVEHAGFVICEDLEPRHIYRGLLADDPLVNRSRPYQAVSGACLLVRRNDFVRVGGFDPLFRSGYEDVDLCLRIADAGREVHYCHESVLGRLRPSMPGDSKLYRERWSARVRSDEFHYYIQDGVLGIDYRPLHPHKLSVSPSLATVNGSDREHQADRLIQARSEQVADLLEDNIRLSLSVLDAEHRLKTLGGDNGKHPHVESQGADALPSQEPRLICQSENQWLSNRTAKRLISIILPVKNGADKLRLLLPAVLSQKSSDLVEIVAIDSASTDESVALLKQANATVVGIDPRRFNHGLTRNLATQYANGTIHVFINQSTLPANDHWLESLVRPFESDSTLAGVCGRMLPRSDADWLTAKDISRNINASEERVVTRIADRNAYASMKPEDLRRFVNFHSLSAAIRADVFQQIPFREANFAEDLMWGKDVLEAGFSIQFEPSSVALHSHNYSTLDIFRRNFDDGAACRRICGRTLDENDIAPAINHETLDDWRYLTEECHLEGEELDRWKLISVARRTAQIFGHWIGVNYESAEMTPARLASILSITERIKAGTKTEQPEEFFLHARSIG